MIDLLTCFITFAFESIENFTVCVGFIGMFGVFARPLQKHTYKPSYIPNYPPKSARSKPPKPRKAKSETPRKHAKQKRQKPKQKSWATLPNYTQEQLQRINEYYAKRDGKKQDEWTKFNIPL